MASPVGHGLMGVALYTATVPRRRLLKAGGWLALCVGASVLPDLDFILPAAVGRIDTAQWAHRSLTHTVFFAIGGAAVWFGILRLLRRRWKTAAVGAAIVLVCLLAHLALDVMNEDTRAPYGVAVFWPLSRKTFYEPVGFLPRVEKATYADLVSWHNVTVALTELAVFGALIAAVLGVRFGLARLTRPRHVQESTSPSAEGGKGSRRLPSGQPSSGSPPA
jgi:inner membrane protein